MTYHDLVGEVPKDAIPVRVVSQEAQLPLWQIVVVAVGALASLATLYNVFQMQQMSPKRRRR